MFVLVTYDINVAAPEGAKRLRRVAKQCCNYGIRVQNSVFECIVDAAQFTKLKHMLLKEIKKTAFVFICWGTIIRVRSNIMAQKIRFPWKNHWFYECESEARKKFHRLSHRIQLKDVCLL